MSRYLSKFSTTALMGAMIGMGSGYAQSLPGGASNLSENHNDWQVVCESADTNVACVFLQTQVVSESGQRLISVKLQPSVENGAVTGALVLPFGLAVSKGVEAFVTEDGPRQTAQFATCLPVGCVIPLQFDAAFVETLRAGAEMTIEAGVDGTDEKAFFSVSLSGFSAALNRARELSQ